MKRKTNKTINPKEYLTSLRIITSNRNKLNENKFRPIYKINSGTNSFNNQNNTFEKISFLSNSKEGNYKRKIQYNNNSNNKGFKRNKINQLDFIKTDIKNDSEYIKIKDIFQNINNSNKLIHSHIIQSTKNQKENKTSNKTYSNENQKSLDFKSHVNTNKNSYTKIILKHKNNIIRKNNEFSNDVIKSNFFKNNISINVNKKKNQI